MKSNFGKDDDDDQILSHEQEHAAQASSHEAKSNHDTPYLREQIVTPAAYVLFYIRRGLTFSSPEDFENIKTIPTSKADYLFEQANQQDDADKIKKVQEK